MSDIYEPGDKVWVVCSYTRPSEYTFVAQSSSQTDKRTVVRGRDGSLELVRTKDVFETEKEALEITLARAKFRLHNEECAVHIYKRLIGVAEDV